jgi:predicted RNA-binding protein with PIN domain
VRWLVDGMNLIGSRPDGWWRDRAGARRRLVGELDAFARRAGPQVERVDVVFDGDWRAEEVAAGAAVGISVAFAPGGPNAADRVIAELVGALDDPAGTTVVTSDRALVDQIRASGVGIVGVGAFGRLLRSPAD